MAEVRLTDEERETLVRWSRRAKSSQALAQRCRIVLGCAEGKSNQQVAADLGVWPQTVGKWRRRFVQRRGSRTRHELPVARLQRRPGDVRDARRRVGPGLELRVARGHRGGQLRDPLPSRRLDPVRLPDPRRDARELRRSDESVLLSPKAYQLLEVLVDHGGERAQPARPQRLATEHDRRAGKLVAREHRRGGGVAWRLSP